MQSTTDSCFAPECSTVVRCPSAGLPSSRGLPRFGGAGAKQTDSAFTDLVNVLRVHRPLLAPPLELDVDRARRLRFGSALGGSFGTLLDWFGQPGAYLAAPDAAAVLLRGAAPLWDADHLAAAAAAAIGAEGSADAQWGAVATPRPASPPSEEAAAAATAAVLACNAAAAALSADPDGPQTAAEAARCAEEALNLLPHWSKAGYRLGYALHRLGRPGDAEAAVERAMLLSRLTKQVGRQLVRALAALGWPADEALVPHAFAASFCSSALWIEARSEKVDLQYAFAASQFIGVATAVKLRSAPCAAAVKGEHFQLSPE